MRRTSPRLVVVVRPSADRRRLPELLRWLRWLLPAAILLVGPARLPEAPDTEVIQFDCTEGFDGPLSVASKLALRLHR